MGFPGGSVVKNPSANAGDVGSIPGSRRSLQKEMATHSSISPWEIPWREEPGGLQSMGLHKSWIQLKRLNKNSNNNLSSREIRLTNIFVLGTNNLRYANDTTLMAESEEELKSLLMKVKEESENVGSKLNIQKTKIMASGPITSWQIDGETVETVADFIFLGSKITADGDCSHEIKRSLLPGRQAMTNLDSILKSRDIILQTKVHLVKAMVFPVVMYGCESWTIKKAERQRTDAFELWY